MDSPESARPAPDVTVGEASSSGNLGARTASGVATGSSAAAARARLNSAAILEVGTLLGGLAIEKTGSVSLVYMVIGVLVFLIPLPFARTALGRAEQYVPVEEKTDSALKRAG